LIDEQYAKRISSVIEACDQLGMVVILQLFYFGQDTVFETWVECEAYRNHENQICSAVDHAVDYVCTNGYRNVIIEIANEVMEGHYHHAILKPGRVAELIHRVRERARNKHGQTLLVSTSEAALLSPRQWTQEQIDDVYEASDLVIIHGGDVEKVELFQSRPWFQKRPRPIITNESQGEQAFDAMVKREISFGLHSTYFQTVFPPKWGVWENETLWFFHKVKELTGSKYQCEA